LLTNCEEILQRSTVKDFRNYADPYTHIVDN
jgi:hypothetical protein